MEIKFTEEKEIDGKIIYSLFKSAGWILPRSEKPTSHQKIDGISNHTIYLDSEDECEILEKAFKNSDTIFVAKSEARIVGFVRVISDKCQRSFIYDLVVDPNFQNIGIGKSLVKLCINKYSNTQITLGTATPTMKFYEKLGFIQSINYMEIATESY
ncbi:MAG: hypothetical protein RL318_647 [Fibrobacterota bacterium]|jgi:ribosomal protein S18 acetylase RimI-like enzyme